LETSWARVLTGAYIGQPAWVRRTIDSVQYYFNMSYDSFGRLNVLTYPTSTSGYRFKADYDYDAYGQLSAVKDGNETYTYYTLDETDALGRERVVSLGNGRTETRDYDEAAGYLKTIATDGGVQALEFTYDEVGNVLTRFDDLIDETETFTYDNLNRLKTAYVTGESTITMNYSAAGRITSKTGVGSYTYGAGSAGPFAVTSANGASYGYDANGRMTSRGGSTITWYSYDQPKKINSGTKSTEFWYGPDRARYKQELRTSGALDAVITYVGQLFEWEDAATDTYRHYVTAGSRVVAMVERVGTTNTKQFLHRDHQSSVTKITNAGGTVDQALAFDAWGLRRDATDWSALGSPFAGSHATERGYTGHEHLDTVGLIHMNGRVQDPILGRFISADPIVQAPYNTQSHNRYSYVWNNPASMIDPSGFCALLKKDGKGNGTEGCTDEDWKAFCEHYDTCDGVVVVTGSRGGTTAAMPGVSSYGYNRGSPFGNSSTGSTAGDASGDGNGGDSYDPMGVDRELMAQAPGPTIIFTRPPVTPQLMRPLSPMARGVEQAIKDGQRPRPPTSAELMRALEQGEGQLKPGTQVPNPAPPVPGPNKPDATFNVFKEFFRIIRDSIEDGGAGSTLPVAVPNSAPQQHPCVSDPFGPLCA
jgi:RHS repeat-associated protein